MIITNSIIFSYYIQIIVFHNTCISTGKNYDKIINILDIIIMSEEGVILCAHCHAEIGDKSYAKVGELAYHVEHFICGECSTTLAGKKFKSLQQKVYCLDCYSDKFAITCAGCKLKILGKYVKVESAKFHKDCFVCQYCTEQFDEEGCELLFFILKATTSMTKGNSYALNARQSNRTANAKVAKN